MQLTTKRGRKNAGHEKDKELRLSPEAVKEELDLREESPGAEKEIKHKRR